MALKFKPKATDKKSIILANSNPEYLTGAWNNKTLFDIAEMVDIERIFLATSTTAGSNGQPIQNLVLELSDKKVAFPLSRNFDESLLDPDKIQDCQFYVRRKYKEGEQEAKVEPTGDFYVLFGKPSGITFASEELLVGNPVEKVGA